MESSVYELLKLLVGGEGRHDVVEMQVWCALAVASEEEHCDCPKKGDNRL